MEFHSRVSANNLHVSLQDPLHRPIFPRDISNDDRKGKELHTRDMPILANFGNDKSWGTSVRHGWKDRLLKSAPKLAAKLEIGAIFSFGDSTAVAIVAIPASLQFARKEHTSLKLSPSSGCITFLYSMGLDALSSTDARSTPLSLSRSINAGDSDDGTRPRVETMIGVPGRACRRCPGWPERRVCRQV